MSVDDASQLQSNESPRPISDADARRDQALARLERTGNVDAVARAFGMSPHELAALAGQVKGDASRSLADLEGRSIREARVAPRVAKPRLEPLPWLPLVAISAGALPLLPWPYMAMWAVIGGFLNSRSLDTEVFGWSLILYPAVYFPCAIVWFVCKRRWPEIALAAAVVPSLQALVCVVAFVFGL